MVAHDCVCDWHAGLRRVAEAFHVENGGAARARTNFRIPFDDCFRVGAGGLRVAVGVEARGNAREGFDRGKVVARERRVGGYRRGDTFLDGCGGVPGDREPYVGAGQDRAGEFEVAAAAGAAGNVAVGSAFVNGRILRGVGVPRLFAAAIFCVDGKGDGGGDWAGAIVRLGAFVSGSARSAGNRRVRGAVWDSGVLPKELEAGDAAARGAGFVFGDYREHSGEASFYLSRSFELIIPRGN